MGVPHGDSAQRKVSGGDRPTCLLAQQPSGLQHPAGVQAALDGCFFLLARVSDLGHQLPSQGIVHRESDGRSSVEKVSVCVCVCVCTLSRNSSHRAHLLYPAEPAAPAFVFILKLQLLSWQVELDKS